MPERDRDINMLAERGFDFAKDLAIKIKAELLVPCINNIDDWLYTLEFGDLTELSLKMRKCSFGDDSVEAGDWAALTDLLARLEHNQGYQPWKIDALAARTYACVVCEIYYRKGLIVKQAPLSLFEPIKVAPTTKGSMAFSFIKGLLRQ